MPWPIILHKIHGNQTASRAVTLLQQHGIDANGSNWIWWMVDTVSVYVSPEQAIPAEEILRSSGYRLMGNPLTPD